MPLAFLLIVSIVVYNTGLVDKVKNSKQETTAEVIAPKVEAKTTIEDVKITQTQPELIKEEVKAEIKQPEIIKEEVKAEIKQPEPIKEATKEGSKIEQEETIKVDQNESNYLRIILYVVGAIAAIFGGFYYFSNRGSSQSVSSTVDTTRRDIEESYHPESGEQQPVQEESQTETQEQQPAQEESQTETQEQQPAQEETQTENTEPHPSEKDENNNK